MLDELSLAIDYALFFFKQKTAYEMCGRDWSSDVCSSDLPQVHEQTTPHADRLALDENDHDDVLLPDDIRFVD